MSTFSFNQEGSGRKVTAIAGTIPNVSSHRPRIDDILSYGEHLQLSFAHATRELSGGTIKYLVVEKLSVLCYNALMHDGVECRLLYIESKGHYFGIPMALCRVVSLDNQQTVCSVHCVPPGVELRGFSCTSVGEYECSQDDAVVTVPAIHEFQYDIFDPPFVLTWNRWLACFEICFLVFYHIAMFFLRAFMPTKYLRLKLSRYWCYPLYNLIVLLNWCVLWLCPVSTRFQVRLVSVDILHHIYNERLNTLSNVGSIVAFRLTLSSVQRAFKNRISQSTVYNTVHVFCSRSVNEVGGYLDDLTNSAFISRLADVPRVFDVSSHVLHVGAGFVESEECMDIPPVTDNGKLRLKASSRGCDFANGVLFFERPYKKPASVYFYGPHYASASVRYTPKSTQNISSALTRMTNSRVEERGYRIKQDFATMFMLGYCSPNLHVSRAGRSCAKLVGAFGDWGLPHTGLRHYMASQSDGVLSHLLQVKIMFRAYLHDIVVRCDAVERSRISSMNKIDLSVDYADEPHPKRGLRQLCVTSMMDIPSLWDKGIPAVKGKVKWETAKHNKVARQFISLGDTATLYWPDVSRFMKESFDKDYYSSYGFKFRFIKECSPLMMDEFADNVGRYHMGLNGLGYFYFHSDDSNFGYDIHLGGVQYHMSMDLDIAKCDLSHGPGVFALVVSAFHSFGFTLADLKPLFDQLRSDVVVQHPDNKCDDVAIFELNEITLFSGHTLTTVVNNFACILIGLSLLAGFNERDCFTDESDLRNYVSSLAAFVGYEVTIDTLVITPFDTQRPRLSKMMFLKHSPVWAYDRFVACKCLSTVVRNYGLSDEFVDCEQRRREILLGLTSSHRCVIFDYLLGIVDGEYSPLSVEFDTSDLEWRYGVSVSEMLAGLELLFGHTAVLLVTHPALEAVCQVGYGLTKYG